MLARTPYVLGLLLLALACAGTARAQEAAAAEVRQAAEQLLAARYPDRAERMQVRVRRTGGSFDDRIDGEAALRLDFPGHDGAVPEGLAQVQVQRRVAGRWQKTGWALLHVAHFDSLVTMRVRVRAGEAVTPEHVGVAWMETTDVHGEPLRAADFRARTAEGRLLTTRLVRAGRVLRRRDVRAPYTVDTGGAVEMHYARGRLAFRLSCKAREPGFADDAIRVYCPGTRTTYRARLTGEHTAHWVETL